MSNLAINGGKPVRTEPFLRWPIWDEQKERALLVEACQGYERYAVFAATGYGDIINGNGMLRTMEQMLVDLVTDNPLGCFWQIAGWRFSSR